MKFCVISYFRFLKMKIYNSLLNLIRVHVDEKLFHLTEERTNHRFEIDEPEPHQQAKSNRFFNKLYVSDRCCKNRNDYQKILILIAFPTIKSVAC